MIKSFLAPSILAAALALLAGCDKPMVVVVRHPAPPPAPTPGYTNKNLVINIGFQLPAYACSPGPWCGASGNMGGASGHTGIPTAANSYGTPSPSAMPTNAQGYSSPWAMLALSMTLNTQPRTDYPVVNPQWFYTQISNLGPVSASCSGTTATLQGNLPSYLVTPKNPSSVPAYIPDVTDAASFACNTAGDTVIYTLNLGVVTPVAADGSLTPAQELLYIRAEEILSLSERLLTQP